MQELTIESLPWRFSTVATELSSGREIWLQSGSLLDAVRASVVQRFKGAGVSYFNSLRHL